MDESGCRKTSLKQMKTGKVKEEERGAAGRMRRRERICPWVNKEGRNTGKMGGQGARVAKGGGAARWRHLKRDKM